MEAIETITRGEYVAKVYPDECPESPEGWTRVGTLAYDAPRGGSHGDLPSDSYGGGRFTDDCPDCEGEGKIERDPSGSDEWDECATCKGTCYVTDGAMIAKRMHDAVVTLPVRAWDDRNGTELRIADDWEDANGWIFATAASIAETVGEDATPEQIAEALKGELTEWMQWAQGEVYRVVVECDDEHVDSCGGFYGYDYALEEANRMLDDETPNNQNRRRSTLDKLEASDCGPSDLPAGELKRYIALTSTNCGRTYHVTEADTKALALEALEESIGDATPVSVIDLETGTEYPVETKLVTRDEYVGEWRNEEGETRYCPTCSAELEHMETDGDGPGEWGCFECDEGEGKRFHYGQTLDAPKEVQA